MILYVIVAVVVMAAVIGWLFVRRGGEPDSEVRRDVPTIEISERIRPRFGTRLGGLFSGAVDASFWKFLEEGLVAADVGVAATTTTLERVRARNPCTPDEARMMVREVLLSVFRDRDRTIAITGVPAIVVVVGVNGSGKTTTVAKLAARQIAAGMSVLVGAADTFRAAAAEQMAVWGERVGFDVVSGAEGADSAAVAIDALFAARARAADVLIVDTAGRLHSKQNLMDELAKVVRVLSSEAGFIDEILLVLDGSTGQNGIAQARAFINAVGVTGIVITKLDGSAKGGVALAVESELGVPLKLVGLGESSGDLLHFDPSAFVDDLLGDV